MYTTCQRINACLRAPSQFFSMYDSSVRRVFTARCIMYHGLAPRQKILKVRSHESSCWPIELMLARSVFSLARKCNRLAGMMVMICVMRHARTNELRMSGPTVHSLYCDLKFASYNCGQLFTSLDSHLLCVNSRVELVTPFSNKYNSYI